MLNQKNIAKCPNCKKRDKVTSLTDSSYSKINKDFYILFCNSCLNGFLYPVPKDLGKYYSQTHWQHPGLLSSVRYALHDLWQQSRKEWVEKYLKSGSILDVGAGEGIFGEKLGSNFQVTNLESSFAVLNNKNVIKTDFLKWRSPKKFDGIVFLESLEHVPSPEDYLKKAESLLKKGGYIFIEYPRCDSWESKFFKGKWLHLDIPRHLAQLTRKGLRILALRNNLKIVSQKGMLVYELSPYGFTISLMDYLGIKPLSLKEKSVGNLMSILIALIILPLGVIVETIFHLFDQDPIELSVFQKI